MSHRKLVLLLLPLLLVSLVSTASAEEAKSTRKFLRVVRDAKSEPISLDTSIVKFVPKEPGREGLSVDLIGAVHVGEKSYYDELNKAFKKYDALLFELVAPEGTKIPKGGGEGSGHPVALLQNGMKEMLELDHQLACIDYTKKNFVHADMTPEQFAKSMADRGESMLSMMFRAMGQSMAAQKPGKSPETEMLFALFAKDRASSLKRVMAEQFEDMEGMMDTFGGPDGSAIITDRNKAALAVLKKEIAAGRKKIGIFYGAAHLPDMEERLEKEFDLKMVEERWVTAWNLRPKAEAKKSK